MKRPRNVEQRLRALLAHHGVDEGAAGPLSALLVALSGDPMAPTTVRDRAQAVDVHVADSLTALDVAQIRSARRIADLGAGAGLPGLVLAATLPDAEVVLVESIARKCAFLTATADAMGLTNVVVVNARVEDWTEGSASCDAVTARALAPLPVLCEYAAPLLPVGGALVAWKGAVGDEEANDGRAAARFLGLGGPEVRRTDPYVGSRQHALWIFGKESDTPPGFPRRAGMATKRPLGEKALGRATR